MVIIREFWRRRIGHTQTQPSDKLCWCCSVSFSVLRWCCSVPSIDRGWDPFQSTGLPQAADFHSKVAEETLVAPNTWWLLWEYKISIQKTCLYDPRNAYFVRYKGLKPADQALVKKLNEPRVVEQIDTTVPLPFSLVQTACAGVVSEARFRLYFLPTFKIKARLQCAWRALQK